MRLGHHSVRGAAVATYGEDGKVDVMNMAWGGICAENMVLMNIDESHKTAANLKHKQRLRLASPIFLTLQKRIFLGLQAGIKYRINLNAAA